MTIVRAQHCLQGDSGIPGDQFVNTFYFSSGTPPTGGDFTNMLACIQGYFDTAVSGLGRLTDYMSSRADTNGLVKFYDMGIPSPRPLLHSETLAYSSFGDSGHPNLPTELAVAQSYRIAHVAGYSAGSERGRIYIGPLNTKAMIEVYGLDDVTVHPEMRSLMNTAAVRMAAQASTFALTWGMWSAKHAAFHAIVEVSVDDAFDVQRRRGIKPSLREKLAV
jgi:hypothetical protein